MRVYSSFIFPLQYIAPMRRQVTGHFEVVHVKGNPVDTPREEADMYKEPLRVFNPLEGSTVPPPLQAAPVGVPLGAPVEAQPLPPMPPLWPNPHSYSQQLSPPADIWHEVYGEY